jgi:hypothetical protein
MDIFANGILKHLKIIPILKGANSTPLKAKREKMILLYRHNKLKK